MDSTAGANQDTAIEQLLAEFNEILRCEGRADFNVLRRCPIEQRKELLSLLNVATLAYFALAPEREDFLSRHPARKVS